MAYAKLDLLVRGYAPLASTSILAATLLAACGGGASSTGTTSTTTTETNTSTGTGTGGEAGSGGTGTTSSTGTTGTTSTGTTSGQGGGMAESFVYSPYKDMGINFNWNTNVLSTEVTGAPKTLLEVLPAGVEVVTWAFATGECGAETWAGLDPTQLVAANVQAWSAAGKRYIISTGGAAGSFTCGTDAGFETFLARYESPSLVGIDFDIEAGQTQAEIDDLVERVIAARKTRPDLRVSFTLATLAPSPAGATMATSMGASAPDPLGFAGTLVMESLAAHGLDEFIVNLMVMDYGGASSSICVVGQNGLCDMGQSAIQAAMDLHDHYGLQYDKIELTPMIGMNDITDEVFSLADADTMMAFVKTNGLAGAHFWSLDRDNDCQLTYASSTCNSFNAGGLLGFTKRFAATP